MLTRGTPVLAAAGPLDNKTLLVKWAATYTLPLVSTFSGEAAPKIFRGALRNHLLYFSKDPAGVCI